MQPKHALLSSFSGATFLAIVSLSSVQAAPLLIVGNDEKLLWDDQGKPIVSPAGKDSVVILDVADPESPKIVANLPLKNSVVGPPVNLAIDPTNSIALVADSIDVSKDGDALKYGPDNKVYVIDLKASPPKLVDTVTVGKQPSGLSFNPAGNLALVTNRADKSISVLSVKGTDVKVIDTVDMGDIVSHVEFTPDGKRALATKFNAHKVSLLDINGDKVTYTKLDLPTGQWPYNVAVAPSGKIALTADNGPRTQSHTHYRPRRGRRWAGRACNLAEGRRGGRGDPGRFQQQKRLFLQAQRQHRGSAYRRQASHQSR